MFFYHLSFQENDFKPEVNEEILNFILLGVYETKLYQQICDENKIKKYFEKIPKAFVRYLIYFNCFIFKL